MCSIGNRTCVRFFPRSNEKDFIKIVSRHGCWSYVGRQGGKQLVSLEILNENGQSCLNGTSVEHELLHVLGFLHEHTRMDRDEFIKIDLDNVEAKFRGQFAKYSRRNSWYRRIPYDIRSVMHYASEAFARDPQKPVITTLTLQNAGSITLSGLIRPATVLSDLDYERINEAYGCSPQSPGLTCGVPLTGSTSGYGYSANDDSSCVYRSSTGLDDGSSDPVTDNTCKKFNPGSAGHPG
ncbi:hatching enzyme 1.2-like [Paramacrobiotus metropolitanus]|nr:hatching enzyme 1.2-like [Paramacrobiotus metropolitanus]